MSKNTAPLSILEMPGMPEVCLLRFSGDLDSGAVASLDGCLAKIPGGDKKHAIADMSAVTIITSAALGKLLGIKRRFVEKGGDLVLAAMNLELKMKFTLMGANKIFRIYNDTRSASNAYAWEVKHETEHIKLSFPARLTVVPAVRNFVSRVMVHKGYSDRDSFRIETIVDEICNNAVEYGSHESRANISLRLKVDWEKVELDAENISDPRKKDQLMKHMKNLQQNLPLDGDDKRGRGLALVKMLASELVADITDTGTTIHVTKLKEE